MKKPYSFERVRNIFNYPTLSKWRRSGGDRRIRNEGYRSMETGTAASTESDRRTRKDRRGGWLDVVSRILYPKKSDDIHFSAWH